MLKKLLSVTLASALLISLMVFPASAEDLTINLDGIDGYSYTITDTNGTCYYNDDAQFGTEQIKITTQSLITFNFPVDFLDIWDSDNEETVFMPNFAFFGGEDWIDTGAVDVYFDLLLRKDYPNDAAYTLEKGDFDIQYFKSGSQVRFRYPGNYWITVFVGWNSADERIDFVKKYGEFDPETGHYVFDLCVRVEEADYSYTDDDYTEDEYIPYEPEYNINEAYNKSLISIDGIKDIYHSSEFSVGQEGYIAYSASPTVITAACDLDDFSVYPMYYINEHQLWDNATPIYPDGKKAQDYDWYERHQEIYKNEPDINLVEYVYAKKGEKYTLTQPGYYHVYGSIYDESGNYENDIRTDIVIKITDLNAIYTSSKVLVDGAEVNFEAYNIEGNNYFKLRDIAMLLNKNNVDYQFINVTWNAEKQTVDVIQGEKYVPVGGEFAPGDGISKIASYGANELYINGWPVKVRAYNVNGNNYFKLRDLAELFYFDVGWDANANSVIIDTKSKLIH